MNIAYNIDCMEYMKTLPDKAFELAIVDPPYGISINHNMGRRKGEARATKWGYLYFKYVIDTKKPKNKKKLE